MAVREASHAGSWYSGHRRQLAAQLDQWLSKVPEKDILPGVETLPLPGARVVISPHAGYAYSGPCAAWAYKCLDLSKAKRIFILHPSHHHHLSTAALPEVEAYETPLSPIPLPLDHEIIKELSTLSTTAHGRTIKFTKMSRPIDEAEHSAEMQLPYIHRLLQKLYPDQPESSYPPLVPIMVGGTNAATEAALGKMLAPYIADESNAFIISSDFCHWGSRFGYTCYLSDAPSPALSPLMLPNGVRGEFTTAKESVNDDVHKMPTLGQGQHLRSGSQIPKSGPQIFESIAHADRACMCAIATGQHSEFLRVIRETGNTVCGRHPIGVFMAGVEEVERLEKEKAIDGNDSNRRRFRFMRYERSSDAETVKDSSVSYVSAFAVL
ncbi:AmmeMemoRadiSam system protein B [Rhinocladiella mackenziei CBS 650.93]|uniref:AmmeMemoRadiSam system protein B n=1 Tax=Rhinocladiella mackenziei CBS 650.93 TaxID=1442369 RepID=A0A0D2JD39_9EURO|nr:AmmeMemoRadiSam system protein B [Rhinocladiella mackenziei CBS 650.93]KIX07050.1 AmmeMemoRadiSam system protein B [Rhinocladiella mackenziei CBS 650.93]